MGSHPRAKPMDARPGTPDNLGVGLNSQTLESAMSDRSPLKHLLTLAALGICLGLLPFVYFRVALPAWSASRKLAEGKALLATHDYREAAMTLEASLAADPHQGEAAFLLARAYRCLGDASKARISLSNARVEGYVPDLIDLEHTMLRVSIAGLTGSDGAALKLWAGTHHPEELVILEALSRSAIDSFFMVEAHDWLSKWIDRDPDDWLPLVWRGEILTRFSHHSMARADFTRALGLRSDAPGADAGLGKCLVQEGREAAMAEPYLRKALERDPSDIGSRAALALSLEQVGRVEEARKEAKEVLAAQPGNAEASRLLARIELEAGNGEGATRLMEDSLRVVPGTTESLTLLAQAQAREGKIELAKATEKKAAGMRNDEKKLESLTREILAREQSAEVRCRIAEVMARLGRLPEAKGWYTSALGLDPLSETARKGLQEINKQQRNN